ncbi:DMKN isoform 51, partial [Pan troglodytes]
SGNHGGSGGGNGHKPGISRLGLTKWVLLSSHISLVS